MVLWHPPINPPSPPNVLKLHIALHSKSSNFNHQHTKQVTSPPDVLMRKRPLSWLLRYLRAREECVTTGAMSLISMGISDIPQDVMSDR